MNGKNVKIVIATHKKYRMPKDKMYIPIHVGAECRKDKNGNAVELGYIKDNTGDNISKLNSSFCELSSFEQLTNYRMMWICHWWKKNPMSIISVH